MRLSRVLRQVSQGTGASLSRSSTAKYPSGTILNALLYRTHQSLGDFDNVPKSGISINSFDQGLTLKLFKANDDASTLTYKTIHLPSTETVGTLCNEVLQFGQGVKLFHPGPLREEDAVIVQVGGRTIDHNEPLSSVYNKKNVTISYSVLDDKQKKRMPRSTFRVNGGDVVVSDEVLEKKILLGTPISLLILLYVGAGWFVMTSEQKAKEYRVKKEMRNNTSESNTTTNATYNKPGNSNTSVSVTSGSLVRSVTPSTSSDNTTSITNNNSIDHAIETEEDRRRRRREEAMAKYGKITKTNIPIQPLPQPHDTNQEVT